MKKNTLGIYTIECFFGEYWSEEFRRYYCGYYFNKSDAEYSIEHNVNDISEHGYYKYAKLGFQIQGTYTLTESIQWYEFIWDFNVKPRRDGIIIPKFIESKKIETPEMYKTICL